MSDASTPLFKASADLLRPHVEEAIAYLGYFSSEAVDFLSSLAAAAMTNPDVVRKVKPSDMAGLSDHMARNPVGAVEAVVARARKMYICQDDWVKAKRNSAVLPYMRIRFCAWCEPDWAEKEILVEVDDLSGPPLRNCRLPACQGFAYLGTHRLLKDRVVVPVKGKL